MSFWGAAIFHFMTHAFFKALLFLGAGIIIESLHHEHSVFKMGGLRKELPVIFWTFIIGGCSLAGLPLITAGFYSKGLIIWGARVSDKGSATLWLLAVFGVLLTSIYTFRLIFLVFFGEPKTHVSKKPGLAMTFPCVILATLSIVGGFVNTPEGLGNVHVFTDFMTRALPPMNEASAAVMSELTSEGVVTLAFLLGLGMAYFLYLARREYAEALTRPAISRALHQWWLSDWGMDWLYDKLFVQPILWFSRINKSDVIDAFYSAIASLARLFWAGLRTTETGRVRWYAAGLVLGSVIFLAIALFL